MLFKRLFLFIFFSFISTLSLASSIFTSPSFTSAEHIIIGDSVKIYLSDNDPGKTGILLHLNNGMNLTYGTLLALGDFYGIPDKAISDGNTKEERQERFLSAFNAFSATNDAIPELKAIINVMQDEQQLVEEGLKQGKSEEDIYKTLGEDLDRQYNCITGGGCASSTWWAIPGRYLLLAENNVDHFGQDALTAYQTGHDIAINMAISAHQNNDTKKLELAYAINAFACHFLSDRFAAGHMRTPRRELPNATTPRQIGMLLANYMHNEENSNGLHVHNQYGDHWLAFGDKSYFSEHAEQHRQQLLAALQSSANQLFLAYQKGYAPHHDSALALIPMPDEVDNAGNEDISPLFYWYEPSQTVMRRKDLENTYDRHWTTDWWGWTTLLMLKENRGLPLLGQASLFRSTLRDQAIQAGLISDPRIINYFNASKNKLTTSILVNSKFTMQ